MFFFGENSQILRGVIQTVAVFMMYFKVANSVNLTVFVRTTTTPSDDSPPFFWREFWHLLLPPFYSY
jgi:hypothetical protein